MDVYIQTGGEDNKAIILEESESIQKGNNKLCIK